MKKVKEKCPTTFTGKVPKSNNFTKTVPKANNHLQVSQRAQVFPKVYAGNKNDSVKGFIPKKPTGTVSGFKHSLSNNSKLTSGVALKVSKVQKNSKNLDKGQMTSQNSSVSPKKAKDVSFQVKKPSHNVTSGANHSTQTSPEQQKRSFQRVNGTATGFSNSSKDTLFFKETAAKTSGVNNSSTFSTNRAPGMNSTSNTSSTAFTELLTGPKNSSKIGSLHKTTIGTHSGTKKSTGAPSKVGPESKTSLQISGKPSQKTSKSSQNTRMGTKIPKKPEEPAKNSSRVTSKNNDGSLSVTIEVSNSTTKTTDTKPKKQNPSKQMLGH